MSQNIPPILSRDFKGIWIPREIWLRTDITITEKALWAEVHSLYDRERGGCYASEDYLCAFLGLARTRLYEMLKHLKDLNLLENISFDGRQTIRRALIPPQDLEPDLHDDRTAAVRYSGQQTSGKADSRGALNRTPPPRTHTYTERKEEKKDNTNTAANAAEGVGFSSSLSGKEKLKAEKPKTVKHGDYVALVTDDYQALCSLHSKNTIDDLIDEMNDYCASHGKTYKDYFAALRNWVRKRQNEPSHTKTPLNKSTQPSAFKGQNFGKQPAPHKIIKISHPDEVL